MLNINKKISLRDFAEKDIENKVNWINDSRNNEFLHYELPLEYEKTLAWFKGRNLERRNDFVIEYEGHPVGLIGLLNIDYENQKAEYYVSMGDVLCKGKGIATNASYLLLQHAFETLKLNKIYLNVDYDNVIARRMYDKVGFKEEGIFREDLLRRGKLIDRVRYAYFKKDWIERKLCK